MFAALLNLCVAAGIAALGAKFFFGPVPAPHHAEILSQQGIRAEGGLHDMLAALYKAVGGAAFATAIGLAALAIFAQMDGASWAFLAALVMALALGAPVTLSTRKAEAATGVRTPWRPAVALTAGAVLAFLLSLF